MEAIKIKDTLLHKTRKNLRPVLKNNRTASYFTLTLTLFCLSFFGLFAIRPTLITAVSLIKEVADLRDLSLKYENRISVFITAQTEYEKIRESIPLIDSALPENSDFPKFARTIELLALKDNITINQLQIDSAPISLAKPDSKPNSFNYILIGIGTYRNVYTFVGDILGSVRMSTMNSLDFSTEGGSIAGLLRVAIKGKAYYEP